MTTAPSKPAGDGNSLVAAPCVVCGGPVFGTPEAWREAADRDDPPRCVRCRRRPAADAAKLTAAHLVVAALHRMHRIGMTEPTTALIVVNAWRLAPDVFGLKGFCREFPDSARVVCELVKMHRPQAGLVERPAVGRYRLTARGRELAGRLPAEVR